MSFFSSVIAAASMGSPQRGDAEGRVWIARSVGTTLHASTAVISSSAAWAALRTVVVAPSIVSPERRGLGIVGRSVAGRIGFRAADRPPGVPKPRQPVRDSNDYFESATR